MQYNNAFINPEQVLNKVKLDDVQFRTYGT